MSALALVFAGCGGGDDRADSVDRGQSSPASSSITPGSLEARPAGGAAGCDDTHVTFANTTTGTSGTLTSAVATAGYPGSPYLAYAADYAIESDVRSFYPSVPRDGNAVVVQFTDLGGEPGPVEAGARLEWGEHGLTFLVIHATDGERYAVADAGETEGSVVVSAASPDALCFEIDYRDGTVEVSGTVAALVSVH